jgi:hypothetical protein
MTEIFGLPAGNFNVTEDAIDNWSLQSSICTVYDTEDGLEPKGDQIFNVTGNDTADFNLLPWQLAICEFVNDNQVGYFTGGGRVNLNQTDISTNNAEISMRYDDQNIDKVTHGFQLHCDSNSGPNNLEVNWLGNKFHLEQLENALCYEDGTINYGRYNGQCGAYAKWVMDDNGEPGKIDQIVALVIWNSTGDLVLNINPNHLGVKDTSSSGDWINNQNIPDDGEEWLDLEIGNHQWTPHPFKSHGPKNTAPCEEFPPFSGGEDPLAYTWWNN